ncbi:MAG: MBL fold metallo-hydrolase [Thermoleophilia bacterium]
MRLTDDVLLVGGGSYTGFGISADFDAHCYLLDGGDELALVDCGTGTEAAMARLLANVERGGLDPARISRLFRPTSTPTTRAARRALPRPSRARGRISTDAADALETGDQRGDELRPWQRTGLFRRLRLPGLPRRRPAR